MAHSLYKNGYFLIDDEVGTIEQLEGRFSFINQINLYNIDNKKKNMWHLNSKKTIPKIYDI